MHSSANASGSVPNSDTDSPVVPGDTDKQMGGSKRQGEFSDVDEADMEKAGSGQMDKNKERVQQGGGGGKEATTSLPGKNEQGQQDQSGVQDDNAQGQVRALLSSLVASSLDEEFGLEGTGSKQSTMSLPGKK